MLFCGCFVIARKVTHFSPNHEIFFARPTSSCRQLFFKRFNEARYYSYQYYESHNAHQDTPKIVGVKKSHNKEARQYRYGQYAKQNDEKAFDLIHDLTDS